jgi:hypothetical protein
MTEKLVQRLEMVRKACRLHRPERVATNSIENLPGHFTEHYNSLQTGAAEETCQANQPIYQYLPLSLWTEGRPPATAGPGPTKVQSGTPKNRLSRINPFKPEDANIPSGTTKSKEGIHSIKTIPGPALRSHSLSGSDKPRRR